MAIILIARSNPETLLMVASILASVISNLEAILFLTSFDISQNDFLLCAAFGVVSLGIGRLMLVLRAQRLPSTQASLIVVLDVSLTLVWTLLILGLVPKGIKFWAATSQLLQCESELM